MPPVFVQDLQLFDGARSVDAAQVLLRTARRPFVQVDDVVVLGQAVHEGVEVSSLHDVVGVVVLGETFPIVDFEVEDTFLARFVERLRDELLPAFVVVSDEDDPLDARVGQHVQVRHS